MRDVVALVKEQTEPRKKETDGKRLAQTAAPVTGDKVLVKP